MIHFSPNSSSFTMLHRATIFPGLVLRWKVIYSFTFLVVSFIICTAAWPKPGRFSACFTNKTYCWHVQGLFLTNEFSENRSRTKSQYYFSCLLASKHIKIQTQIELQTVQHISDCFCVASPGTTATGFL